MPQLEDRGELNWKMARLGEKGEELIGRSRHYNLLKLTIFCLFNLSCCSDVTGTFV